MVGPGCAAATSCHSWPVPRSCRSLRSRASEGRRVLRVSPVKGPLHYSSVADLAKLIAARELLSIDVTQQLLDRIAVVDGRLQSYVHGHDRPSDRERWARGRQIRAGRYRGPLHGVPIAVKDLCNTRGVRTMAGTKVFSRGLVPDFDATVVAGWKLQVRSSS